jgi:hypothetical protein
MINNHTIDITKLKVFILGCPKTGNTWIRWLIHYIYNIQVIEVPAEFSSTAFSKLPDTFVTHQHIPPSMEFCRWLLENNVVVLTPIRHPGDTFVSLFNFNKWHVDRKTECAQAMALETTFGESAFVFLRTVFPQTYALSLAWISLGAYIIRYEDILVDPLFHLGALIAKIYPVKDNILKRAILLSNSSALARAGIVDSRHFCLAKAGSWVQEFPDEFVEAMQKMEPFATSSKTYSYSWDKSLPAPIKFNYSTIDPFQDHICFDNGQLLGPNLAAIYLSISDAQERWPYPYLTEGDSFWNWLLSPHPDAISDPRYNQMTLTNLMVCIRDSRADLIAAFGDIFGEDRIAFLSWFLDRALMECELPWGLISPAQQAFCNHIRDNINTI